jgi:hypothetical protein
VAKATIFITTPSSQTMVSPTAVLLLRSSFIFLIDECRNSFLKLKPWALKTVAGTAGLYYFEVNAGAFDLQKKLIRLPRNLRYTLWLIQGQSNKFFSPITLHDTKA